MLKFTDGLIHTLSFGAAICAATTASGGAVAVAGGVLGLAAAGGGLGKCVQAQSSADFERHMKSALKAAEDSLRLDARVKQAFTQADVDNTFDALKNGFPELILVPRYYARLGLNTETIVDDIVEQLADMPISAYLKNSSPGRDIAQAILTASFDALKAQEAFWQTTRIYVSEEVLSRLDDLKRGQEEAKAERADIKSDTADIKHMMEAFLANQTGDHTPATQEQIDSFEKAVGHILTSGDVRDTPALEAFKKGDFQDGVNIRMSRLRQEGAQIDDVNREHAQKLRDTGAVAALFDTVQAIEAYEQAIRYDPSNVWDFIELARLYRAAGRLSDAHALLLRVDEALCSIRDKSALNAERGDIASAQGNLLEARAAFETMHDALSERAAQDPGNAGAQRDLSVSHDRIGDVAVAQGDLSAARSAYESGLAIAETLSAQDPGNAGAQRDVAVSHAKLAGLGGGEEAHHWRIAYDTLKRLNDAGKMRPVDQPSLDFLAAKVAEFP